MNSPYSHKLNPALQPHRGYVGFPLLGNISVNLSAGTSFSKVFYPYGNSLVTFLHPEIKKDYSVRKLFHKKITPALDVDYNLLSFGFYLKDKSFVSFGIDLKANSVLYIPRGLLEFLDEGSSNTPYDLGFGFDLNSFIETSAGYSRKIDDKLTVGAKIKYLTGLGNAKINLDGSEILANSDIIRATLTGEMRISVPGRFAEDILDNIVEEGTSIRSSSKLTAGHGGAIDLGASYKVLDNLKVYASITDLGFIRWDEDYFRTTLSKKSIEFEGGNIENLDSILSEDFFSSFTDEIQDELNVTQNQNGKGRTTWLYTKLSLGGEYTFFEDRLGLGLLYQTKISSLKWFHELTASVNYRPFKSLSTSLSYSMLQGYNSIGFALNYRPAYFLNLFVGMDYIPFVFTPQYIPLRTSTFNFQFGLTIPLAAKNKENKREKKKVEKKAETPEIIQDETPFEPLIDTIDINEHVEEKIEEIIE